MPDNKPLRRNYFIKKSFQIDFAVKFLIIIVIEAALAIGLFMYMSRDTLTTAYSGSELRISSTSSFFTPMLVLSNLIIVGVTGIIGIFVLIYMSHRMAGPLYRFEKALREMSRGDLTIRFSLRQSDQFVVLAECINELTDILNNHVGGLKGRTDDILKLTHGIKSAIAANPPANKQIEPLLHDLTNRLIELEETINYFKTS